MRNPGDPPAGAPVEAGLPPDLRRQLARQRRGRQLVALAFLAPLLLFVLLNFVVPVGYLLVRSVDDRAVGAVLPRTFSAIAGWDGTGLPAEPVFEALGADLREAQAARTVSVAAVRLNTARPGYQALLARTARTLATAPGPVSRETLVAIDPRWGQREPWRAIKATARPLTPIYLLAAFDLQLDDDGHVERVPEIRRIFNQVWVRTLWIATVVTVLAALLGYPLAYFLAHARPRTAGILMILVLLPFWTSLLVRTIAWVALLQTQGVVNDLLLFLGLASQRVQLIHNRLGVYVTMCHVLLPYMVLPVYSVMRRVPPTYVRAAASLGAPPLESFWRVYLPLTAPGLGAGAALVFILAVGFYITPALVGGPSDQMISYFIAYYTNESLNWNAGAALSVALLAFTAVLVAAFGRLVGLDRLTVR